MFLQGTANKHSFVLSLIPKYIPSRHLVSSLLSFCMRLALAPPKGFKLGANLQQRRVMVWERTNERVEAIEVANHREGLRCHLVVL